MSLASTLDAIREAGAKRIPEDKRAIIGRDMAALRESDLMDGVIKVGDALPAFALENREGATIRSSDLLARGPLVVSVYRGSW
jgi:hypothetical protein